ERAHLPTFEQRLRGSRSTQRASDAERGRRACDHRGKRNDRPPRSVQPPASDDQWDDREEQEGQEVDRCEGGKNAWPSQRVNELRAGDDPALQRQAPGESIEREEDRQRREDARGLPQGHYGFLNSGSSASWACVSARASAWSASHSRRSASSIRSSAKSSRARALTARTFASSASALLWRSRSAASSGESPPLRARSCFASAAFSAASAPASSCRDSSARRRAAVLSPATPACFVRASCRARACDSRCCIFRISSSASSGMHRAYTCQSRPPS